MKDLTQDEMDRNFRNMNRARIQQSLPEEYLKNIIKKVEDVTELTYESEDGIEEYEYLNGEDEYPNEDMTFEEFIIGSQNNVYTDDDGIAGVFVNGVELFKIAPSQLCLFDDVFVRWYGK